MNVSCPQCKTVFRIDPRKVPAGGIRARCSVCGGVFEVQSESEPATAPQTGGGPAPAAGPGTSPTAGTPTPAAPEVGGTGPRGGEAAEVSPDARPEPGSGDAESSGPDQRPSEPATGEPPERAAPAAGSADTEPRRTGPMEPPGDEARRPPAPEGRESAGGIEEEPATTPAFGRTDPEGRSRRLARALISDMVAYHPERQEVALREGRLKELFREEIKKAWREYVEQVGLEAAKQKPYFREALNEILARGNPVF